MEDLDNFEVVPAETLTKLLDSAFTQLIKAKVAKPPDADLIEGYKQQVAALKRALAQLNSSNT